MGSAVYPHRDHVSAEDIVVDFAWLRLILKGFRRRAVVLLVSLLAVFRALSHALNSPTRGHPIIACVYERHSSPQQGHT